MSAAGTAMAPIKVEQAPTQPPWVTDPSIHWLTVREFAEMYRRSERTVRLWCVDGTLADFGFKVYQDLGGKWWISAPSA